MAFLKVGFLMVTTEPMQCVLAWWLVAFIGGVCDNTGKHLGNGDKALSPPQEVPEQGPLGQDQVLL